jgi:drug/metabolite transporter (DMT)-like permease
MQEICTGARRQLPLCKKTTAVKERADIFCPQLRRGIKRYILGGLFPTDDQTMFYLGELAALSTALFWSFTAVFFTEAGKLIGSFQVNKIRLLFAVLIYATILTITTGRPYPTDVNSQQFFWLGLSGFVGLVLGDGCGFKSLVMIGPRLATLIMASTPIMTTLIAWFFLGERLKLLDLAGIAVTITGIVWVVSERSFYDHQLEKDHPDAGTLTLGILLALGASLGQAAGLVLSKQGMLYAGSTVPPLEASFVRMLAAAPIIWALSLVRGKWKETASAVKNRRAMFFSFMGATFGPFLGVWMSLVAVSKIEAGIAATISATTPVLIIPTVLLYYKEKVSLRAILGAVVAVIGVAMLFLS